MKTYFRYTMPVIILAVVFLASCGQWREISAPNQSFAIVLPDHLNSLAEMPSTEVTLSTVGASYSCTLAYDAANGRYDCTIANVTPGDYTFKLTYTRTDYIPNVTLVEITKSYTVTDGSQTLDFSTGGTENKNFDDDGDGITNFDEIITYNTDPTKDDRPTWATVPTNISTLAGSLYDSTDGTADIADAGQTLTCSGSTDCGFTITVGGAGANPQDCNVSFAAPPSQPSPMTCNLRITATDNNAAALSVGQTISIAIENNPPAFLTPPSGITVTGGATYNQTNGVATDVDADQTLTCTGSADCGFYVAISGAGANPQNCNVSFAAPVTAQTCNLRIVATDNGAPALSVGQTVSITISNHYPTFSTAPINISINGGDNYNQTNGIATDLDNGQTITCSSNYTTCGFSPSVTGSGNMPDAVNCNVLFTAPISAQTCNLRIVATDNGNPAHSVGQTISITIQNHSPAFSTAPTNITITGGSTYNKPTGVATDADTGQTLTCSGSTDCGFSVAVSGAGANPRTCNVSFTAPVPAKTCNLRIVATDDGAPALSVGQTVSITIKNHAPTFSTAPSNITVTGGATYNQTNGAATDVDTGQSLTCSNNGTTCGFTITVTGSGLPANCNVSFSAPTPAQTCNLRITATDNGAPALSVGKTISITVSNNSPTFSTAPSNITVAGGATYNQTNGAALDVDTGQTLKCTGSTDCGFTVTVSGTGANPQNCNISFAAPVPAQTCNLRITATDNGAPALSIGKTISITISNNSPTFSTAPSNITVAGGATYNQTNGVATDPDTGQALTCTGSTDCGFYVAVSGTGANPQNCNVSFNAPVPAQTCNLRIVATDNGAPALSVGKTVSITISNHAPTFSTAPSNITVTSGSIYSRTDGAATDLDNGQTITCSSNYTTCGFSPNVTGSGIMSGTVNCNVLFTAPPSAQTCNLRIMATDNGLPAKTVGATILITVKNNAPTWSTTPSNITITGGATYNQTNGVATDVADTGQTLTCSGSTDCGFTVTVSGAGANPQNCNVSFTASNPAKTCNLRIVATDNGAPPLSVGQTVSITISNHAPTFSTAPSNITVTGGATYNQPNGAATDVDTGQSLTCSNNGTTCGFTITVTGSGSPANCNVNFTAQVPAGTCNLRIAATDNGTPTLTVGKTVSITISNHAPVFSMAPSNIAVNGGATYNQTNGMATDVDIGQTLTCTGSTDCGFTVTVGGAGANPQNCNVSFMAPASAQTCNLRIMATDNGSPALSVGSTISITVNNNAPTWSTAPTNITVNGQDSYNKPNGVAIDATDSIQTLTCSGSSSCGFYIAVSGSGSNPQTCNVSFNAPIPAQTCNLRIAVTDNGAPALSVGQTVSLTISNHAPTWSTAAINIAINSQVTYNQTNGVATDVDNGQLIRCSSNGTTCGFAIDVSGSGTAPGTANCNVQLTAPVPAQTCGLRIMAQDSGSPPMSVGATISITVNNNKPMFTTPPSAITITGGTTYNQTNGVATDLNDPGQSVTCSNGGASCEFTIDVSGSDVAPNSVYCNVQFVAPVPAQTCNLRIVATDNGSPALSVGATIPITINNNQPQWSTPPSDITVTGGLAYNITSGVVVDPDDGQTITCSVANNTCTNFYLSVTGSGAAPSSVYCMVSFTAPLPTQSCSLTVVATDNGSPALHVSQDITITIPNNAPTFYVVPSNIIVTGGSTYNQTNGIAKDVDTYPPGMGQTLTCFDYSDNCSGFIVSPTVTGSGGNPQPCNLSFTASIAAQTCYLIIAATDSDPSNPLTVSQTISITIPNHAPTFTTPPSSIIITDGLTYDQDNGEVTDVDTTQNLSCYSSYNSCSFPVTVSGSGQSDIKCHINFQAPPTSPTPYEVCSLTITVSDDGSPNLAVEQTINITRYRQATAVAAGGHLTCAITSDNGVRCWGYDMDGALGDNFKSGGSSGVPVDVCADASCLTNLSGVTAVAAGYDHACALTTAQGVKCWGINDVGELGASTTGNCYGHPCSTTPVDVCADSSCLTALSGVTAISVGSDHTCALLSSGGVKCWGSDNYGKLGTGVAVPGGYSTTPVDVVADASLAPLTAVVALSAGGLHTCAVTTAGLAKCWGYNGSGQLGNNSTTNSNIPVNVYNYGGSSKFQAISAGLLHTCAIYSYGGDMCWGDNQYGEIGDGSTTNRLIPTNSLEITAAVIVAGQNFTCDLDPFYGLECWGWNFEGELGDGNTLGSTTPMHVISLDPLQINTISASVDNGFPEGGHTCALTNSGWIYCWGDDSEGELGNGAITTTGFGYSTPQRVNGL